MKRNLGFLVLVLALMVMVGCQMNVVDKVEEELIDFNDLQAKALEATSLYTKDQIQFNLNRLAPLFAKVISEDRSLKELLAVEIGKKFDNDYDVLYDMVGARTTKSGNTLAGLLQRINPDSEKLLNSIPYLNISIPVNYEKWSTYDGPIYVIPLRYDVNDIELETITGYDAMGNTLEFDLSTPPDFPVVVIGINERIEPMMKGTQILSQPAQTMAADDGTLNHDEYLRALYLKDTLDPWPWSGSEMYCLYVVGENEWAIKQPYPEVTDANKWYYFNDLIFYYDNVPAHMYWKLEVWESDYDFGSISYSVTGGFNWESQYYHIRGDFSSSAEITNEDDFFGSTQIYFYHSPNVNDYSQISFGGGYIGLKYIETVKP